MLIGGGSLLLAAALMLRVRERPEDTA